MLGSLISKIKNRQAEKRIEKLPGIGMARTSIAMNWTHNKSVNAGWSAESIQRQAEEMLRSAIDTMLKPDPRMAIRERLSELLIHFAELQVLVMEPSPEEDTTGLRGMPGITGELKTHLWELWQQDKKVQDFLTGWNTPKEWKDVYEPILYDYKRLWAWMTVFSELRSSYKDINPDLSKDWVKPYVAAMCAWSEHNFRQILKLPPVLSEKQFDANMISLTMSSFMNRVMEGHQFPDVQWRESMKKFGHGT